VNPSPEKLRIAVIADTHDIFPDSVSAEIAKAHEIWHLGDVCQSAILEKIQRLGPSVTVVKGNNDLFQSWPMEATLKRNGVSFRLIHIPPAPTKLGASDILLHGHTHIPRDEMINGVRILNPGAVGKANKRAPRSYAWLQIGNDGIIEWNIVLI
jgi:putative phosphoesterase